MQDPNIGSSREPITVYGDELPRHHQFQTPRGSGIVCKVCDRGFLTKQKVYRLSGPAVVIGYILLIPSFVVMSLCALIIVASYIPRPLPPLKASRRIAEKVEVENQMRAHRLSSSLIHQVLHDPDLVPGKVGDLTPSQYRAILAAQGQWASVNIETAPTDIIDQAKMQARDEMVSNNIPGDIVLEVLNDPSYVPDDHMDEMPMYQLSWAQDAQAKIREAAYRSAEVLPREDVAPSLLPFGLAMLGSVVFFTIGISAFVSGLLGWLLVMKKWVLRCGNCQAAVAAS
jgi:hypothetical protein